MSLVLYRMVWAVVWNWPFEIEWMPDAPERPNPALDSSVVVQMSISMTVHPSPTFTLSIERSRFSFSGVSTVLN